MKQGMEHGIEYSSFWGSDKVKDSAPNFPKKTDRDWMGRFQRFLDTLGDLALANLNTDAYVIYPVSIVASDNFRWSHWEEGVPIAVLQNELLTIIAPDKTFRKITFVDIPFSHIHSTRTHQSDLADSQSQVVQRAAWDIVLMLDYGLWTYSVNTSKRKGTELRLTFQDQVDAIDVERAINEFKQSNVSGLGHPPRARPMISRSSPMYVGRWSPIQTSKVTKQQEHHDDPPAQKIARDDDSQRSFSDDDAIMSSRTRSSRQQPTTRSLKNTKGSSSGSLSRLDSSGLSSAPTDTYQSELQQKQDNNQPARQSITASPKNMSSAQARPQQQNATAPSHENTSDTPDASTNASSSKESRRRHVATVNDTGDGAGSSEQAASSRSVSKRATHSKGKLPSISQVAKARVSKQIPTKARPAAVTRNKRSNNVKSMKEASSDDDSDEASIFDIPTQNMEQAQLKGTNHATADTRKGRKSQTKRQADSDDEFIPDRPLPEPKLKKKTTNTKRKDAPDVDADARQPKKRTNPKVKRDAEDAVAVESSDGHNSETEQSEPAESVRRNKPEEPLSRQSRKEPRLRQLKNKPSSHLAKQKPVQQAPSPVASTRHSLIGGLLNSVNPLVTSTALFKKPPRPSQDRQSPSTPTKSRSQPILRRSETPTEEPESPNEPLPLMTSSPPTWQAPEGRTDSVRRSVVDTEILSSNSKRVPDSPTAESTAISGHADRDDIDDQKRKGDMQTAKSDPFSHRRAGGKSTNFIRRLTGGDQIHDNPDSKKPMSHITLVNANDSDTSEMEEDTLRAAVQPPPRLRTSPKTTLSLTGVETSTRQRHTSFSDLNEPSMSVKAKQSKAHQVLQRSPNSAAQTAQSSYQKSIAAREEDGTRRDNYSDDSTTRIHAKSSGSGLSSAPLYGSQREAEAEDSVLSASGQPIDDTQMKDQCEDETRDQNQKRDQGLPNNGDADTEGDTTFVNDDDEYEHKQYELPSKAPTVRFPSNRPGPSSSSSHSSTSAESEPSSDPPIPTSQAEELEWEASLEPHQRALHDLLIRASKRVLRHIVDNETAVADIADVFARDGYHLLNQLLERQESAYSQVFDDLNKKKADLTTELESVAKRLAKERKRIKAVA
ncbi:hypothetical protein P153DRAFT_363152 [Dothidotthia symphoricarpi CBS 119687]|uniref:Uncharacterized protein n=1 Tax=Dothidotthia symphoricarpi CBS 119687 TaxID=1392245 RepID=A0A6A6ASM1_9PLEO|nr:uncharacterized protein P153DRAFT_363152 [Dothidotthia symphoricarpi CBS 119687]KAF2134168.1 hypothetical protein P153DRAFT_363152 [Dothidotthia symphoricarpi CBS 119687]